MTMKAIAIISGGLDSSLAIKAIQNQGIEAIAAHFLIPFVMHDENSVYSSAAAKFAQRLNAKFRLIVLGDEYLEILFDPEHGYGKNLNPCIDCKILMLKHAKKIMQEEGASFVVTGEVLGQRPMSQHKQALATIARKSGLDGLLVRPLSAKLLPQTIPQEKGWLKEELLFDFEGRGRKRQIELAKQWGIEEYPWPGGGCLLTEAHFCSRLRDLMEHNQCTLQNIALLKVGRHFRLSPSFKLIVGRNEKDNSTLIALSQKDDICFEPAGLPGPTGIGKGCVDENIKKISAQIIARYTEPNQEVKVSVRLPAQDKYETFIAKAIDDSESRRLMV